MGRNAGKRKRNNKRYNRRKRAAKKKVVKARGQMVQYNRVGTNYFRSSKTYLNRVQYTPGVVNTIINPQVNAMPDLGNIAAIFSYYRINKITYTFRWQDMDSASNTNTLSSVVQPTLYICHNYDGNVTNATGITERKGSRSITFTPERNVFTFTVYPKTISPVYLSSVASGYTINKSRWIDLDYSTVPHYGVLLYIDNVPPGTIVNQTETWDVSFKEAI